MHCDVANRGKHASPPPAIILTRVSQTLLSHQASAAPSLSQTHSYYSIPGRSIFKYLSTSVFLKSSGSIYQDFQRIERQTIR